MRIVRYGSNRRARTRVRIVGALLVLLACLVPALTFASSHSDKAKATPKPPVVPTLPDLRLAMPDKSPTVDPALVADDENVELANMLYTGLVRLDAKYRVQLAAAQKIDISADHSHYTFHIRHGLQFSNGDPITAYDFQFALTRSLDPKLKSPSGAYYLLDIAGASKFVEGKAKSVSGIKVANRYTLNITTRWPVTYFLMELTYPTSFAVDKKVISKLGPPDNSAWYSKPVSSGPFKLKSMTPNDKIVLVPNKHFYGSKPGVRQVTISLSPLPATDLYSYISHNLDVVPLPSYDAALLQKPGVHDTNALAIDGLYMGLNSKPFNDRRVRLALTLALQRQKLTRAAMGPTITPFYGFVPPNQPGYDPKLKAPGYSVKTARALLKKAGYPDGKGFPSVTLSYVSDPALDKLVAKIVSAWHKNLGITIGTRALTLTTLFTEVQSNTLPLYLYGWSADYPDPHDWLSLQWKSDALNNNVHYHSQKFDQLVSTADVTWRNSRRMQLYNAAQNVLLSDTAWIPLYIPHRIAYVRPGVSNVLVTGYGIMPATGSWAKVLVHPAVPVPRTRQ